MSQQVAVLGTGLIGGSLGLRLGATASYEVIGYDERPAEAARAHALGAVARIAATPQEAVAGADLVVVAVPVDRMEELFVAIAGALREPAVVMDVGSSKSAVVAAGEAAFGSRFIGGHPMAGSERRGVEAADPSLFDDAWWILTPTARTSGEAYARARQLVAAVGARPVAVTPDTHDTLVARLSHLPQLVAAALVGLTAAEADPASLGLAAGGFRDVTRIAGSDPDLWVAILRSNRLAVLEALSGYRTELERVAGLLEKDSWSDLRAFLESARRARLELFAKPVYTGDPVVLTMLIPDRPGVLAEVTTAAGALGANIEDVSIFHSTEGGRGRLELVVAGPEAATSLSAKLAALGYHVERGLPE